MAKKPTTANRRIGQGVKKLNKDYDKFARKWKRARDVTSGQDAIYAGGVEYLPMLNGETPDDYKARQGRAAFFNASWRTVAGFVGMIFRKPPTRDIPTQLEAYLKDVTMTGVSFDVFAQDCVYELMTTSLCGIYVDHPPLPGDKPSLTVAAAEKLGLRPSMKRYNVEAIRDWKFVRINNKTVLGQVRLSEVKTNEINEFENEEIPVIRVLDLDPEGYYRVRVFLESNEEQDGEDVYPTMGGQRMTEIPFYFLTPDGEEVGYPEPILLDLFDLNIKHFQVTADYEHGCHLTGLPTPWITGYEPGLDDSGHPKKESFYLGSSTILVFPDHQTKLGMLQVEGGFEGLEKNLDRKEAQMAAIGARMLAPEKTGVEAAETLTIRNSGENSILGAISVAGSNGLTKALNMFGRWVGASKESVYTLNRDFIPFVIDPARMQSLIAAVQAGRMSGETFFDLMQRGDLIPADRTFEDEQERIDATPLPAPVASEDEPPVDKKDPKSEAE